jgi:hypothetical protein
MIVRLGFIVLIYSIILIVVSPIIDHLFTPLHPEEPYYEVLGEFVAQIVVLSITWYAINTGLHYVLSKNNLKVRAHEETAIDVITAVILVGLQKNLLVKLKYITELHPIRDTLYTLFHD